MTLFCSPKEEEGSERCLPLLPPVSLTGPNNGFKNSLSLCLRCFGQNLHPEDSAKWHRTENSEISKLFIFIVPCLVAYESITKYPRALSREELPRKGSFSENLALLEKTKIPEPRPQPTQNLPSCHSRPERSRASQAWLPPWVKPPASTPVLPATPRPCSCRRHARTGSGRSKTPAAPQLRRRGPRLHGLRSPRRPATQAAAPVTTPAAEGTPRLEPCRKQAGPLTIQSWSVNTGHQHWQWAPERSGATKALSRGGSRLQHPPLSRSSTKLRPGMRSAPIMRHLLGTRGLSLFTETERTQGCLIRLDWPGSPMDRLFPPT